MKYMPDRGARSRITKRFADIVRQWVRQQAPRQPSSERPVGLTASTGENRDRPTEQDGSVNPVFAARLMGAARSAGRRPDLWYPVLIVAGSWVVSRDLGLPTLWLSNPVQPQDHAFYTTVAQVFPVLLVALFVEVASSLGAFQREVEAARSRVAMDAEREKEIDNEVYELELKRFRVGMMAASPIVVGEAAALIAIGDGPSAFLGSLAIVCIVVSGFALILVFIREAIAGPALAGVNGAPAPTSAVPAKRTDSSSRGGSRMPSATAYALS
jgi:hypothetical protein